MNWDAVSAVAEVFGGALAVAFTLIYLAVQTMHNALAINQSAQQAMVAEMGSLFADSEGAQIWLKGVASYSSLTAVEKVQLTSLLHHFARTCEQADFSFRVGTLDTEIWYGLEAQALEVFPARECKNGGAFVAIGIAKHFGRLSTDRIQCPRHIWKHYKMPTSRTELSRVDRVDVALA